MTSPRQTGVYHEGSRCARCLLDSDYPSIPLCIVIQTCDSAHVSESTQVTSPLIKALNGIPGVYSYRIQCGSPRVRGGVLHGAPTGTPDIGAIVAGRAVFFECKLTGNVPSGDQVEAHRRLRSAGAKVYVVTSVHEALDVVRDLLSS